jgi:phage terminase small subunit
MTSKRVIRDETAGNTNGEKKKKLKPKVKAFIAAYLKLKNCTHAAIEAGYSKKTAYSIGSELLKKPEVVEALEKVQNKVEEKAIVDAAWVLIRLKTMAEYGMSLSAETGRMYDSIAAKGALELLGKHLALFTDKFSIDTKDIAGLLTEARKRVETEKPADEKP